MKTRSSSVDVLCVIGCAITGMCGISAVLSCIHPNTGVAECFITAVVFWFMTTMLFLMSLRFGERSGTGLGATSGIEDGQCASPPILRIGWQHLLRWTVWVGVISLLASTALQFLGYMKTAMKIDFFGIPLLFLALTTYGIGMLLGKSKQKSNRDAASFRKPPD